MDIKVFKDSKDLKRNRGLSFDRPTQKFIWECKKTLLIP